ncbi:MAG: carboxypeptidase regulatory-like domain-containing protein [Bryobacterales bacterium]|nr:carboxypeptidase regulatory-like domain-containing protein [Bryobacterales bacterium]
MKRKRTGNSGRWLPLCCAAVLAAAGTAAAQHRESRSQSYALIAGTVFQESGLSLRGAEVSLEPDPQDARTHKLKKSRAVSDSRGEFAFRVPAVPSRYTVKVKRAGFSPQEKVAAVSGDERIDLVFRLEPAP